MNHFLGKKRGGRKRALSGLTTRTGAMAKNIKKNLGA
jgi:ribosomal protein L35